MIKINAKALPKVIRVLAGCHELSDPNTVSIDTDEVEETITIYSRIGEHPQEIEISQTSGDLLRAKI